MKIFFALLVLAVAGFAFIGCESDVPPNPGARPAGLTGGEIVQPDKSGDPLIRENTRVGN